MFCCLALSSVVIYAMVRTAAPHQPIWAFVAAALKLVWIANYQIFADHSLAIYFAELLFWISTCALVALLRRPHIRVPMVLVVALHGIMALGLLVTIRTYEASWSIIPLVPLIAIALLSPIWRARSTVMPLVVWYAASLLALGTAFAQHNLLMIVAQATRQNAVLDSDVGLPFGVRFINGLAAVTVDSFTVPAVEIFRTLAGDTTAFSRYSMVPNRVVVAISILGFLALYIFGSAKMKILRRRSSARRLTDLGSSRYGAVSGRLGVAGCLVMVAGVAPLALWTDPVYGTRYIHWATFGTIILVLAACVWTVGRWGRAGVVISGLSLATIFGGSSFYMDQIGTSGEVQ